MSLYHSRKKYSNYVNNFFAGMYRELVTCANPNRMSIRANPFCHSVACSQCRVATEAHPELFNIPDEKRAIVFDKVGGA